MGAQEDLCQNVSWSIGCLTLVESFGSYQTISLIYLLLHDPFKFGAVTTWYYTIFNSHLYIEIYREIYIFRYKEKLTLNDGTIIADPYGLSNNWKNDVLLLPDISWADIHNYIKYTKCLSHENLKAYKSLEVFNFLYAILFKMCSVILFQKNQRFAVSKQR